MKAQTTCNSQIQSWSESNSGGIAIASLCTHYRATVFWIPPVAVIKTLGPKPTWERKGVDSAYTSRSQPIIQENWNLRQRAQKNTVRWIALTESKTTAQGEMLPTDGWVILHQSATKIILHRPAQGPSWQRSTQLLQLLSCGVILGSVKWTVNAD